MKNRVFAIDIRSLKDEKVYGSAYEMIDPARRAKVDRIKNDRVRLLSLGAGLVLAKALDYAGCKDSPIGITDAGKPVVDGCFFNISHAGDIAVCAVSDTEVGIDIEKPRTLHDSLIKRAFTPAELSQADALPEEQKNTLLIRLWTIKESLMKYFGMGLSLMPERIDISVDDPVRATIPDDKALSEQCRSIHFSLYTHEDYMITVCHKDLPFTDDITWL